MAQDIQLPGSDPQRVADAAMEEPLVLRTFDEITDELGAGGVPNLFKALAHNPEEMVAVWHRFKATVLAGSGELLALKYLCGLLAARETGSEYLRRFAGHLYFTHTGDAGPLKLVWQGQWKRLEEVTSAQELTALKAADEFLGGKDPQPALSKMTQSDLSPENAYELLSSTVLFHGLALQAKLLGVPTDEELFHRPGQAAG